VAGELAGIYYGYDGLPLKWVKNLVRSKDIINLGTRLYEAVKSK
jgi:ADP-ribosylglycohydrolase